VLAFVLPALRGDDLKMSSDLVLRLATLDFLLTTRLPSYELPSADVATGAAGAALPPGVGMGRPRGCDEAEEAIELGRPIEDGAKPSRIGGEAVELRLARLERT